MFLEMTVLRLTGLLHTRDVTSDGKIKISFVISVNKVAPLKSLTLARLELITALIGAHLGNYIQHIFPAFTQNIFL